MSQTAKQQTQSETDYRRNDRATRPLVKRISHHRAKGRVPELRLFLIESGDLSGYRWGQERKVAMLFRESPAQPGGRS